MKWKVGLSEIHGNGVFATEDLGIGYDIGLSIPLVKDSDSSRVFQRNTFGLMINHSNTPNSDIEKIGDDWHFVANRYIPEGEEITVNYKEYEKKIDRESVKLHKDVSVI